MSEKRKMGRREWYRSIAKGEREVSGCMSGMFQFLDFHSILFSAPSSNGGRAARGSSSPQTHHYPRSNSQLFNGVEAPRNSLELDEASAAAKTSTAFAIAAEDYYGIPIGIQVNSSAPLPSSLKKQNKKNQGLEEGERRDSQSQCVTPRATNLVARLMGLDASSEGPSTPKSSLKSLNSSPKLSAKNRQPLKKKDANVRSEVGTRSLPDTPRASSERSRDADPRLSLQINKENVSRAGYLCEYPSLPPSPTKGCGKKSRKKGGCLKENDESRSPRCHYYYVGEVVKQVKENTHRRGEEKFLVEDDRKQFLRSPKPPRVLPKRPQPKSATSVLRVRDQNVEITKLTKIVASSCNKASTEKFTDRIKKKPPLSEAATRSDSTLGRLALPPPSQSSSPNLVASSSQKHGLSRESTKRSHVNVATLASRGDYLPASAFSAEEQQGFKYARAPKEQDDPEFLYVQSILQRSGVTSPTQPRRYSPSLAVDPFIFHQLELDLPALFPHSNHHRSNPIRHRSNRKLLFHLVQEVLADLLACRPRLNEANLLDRVWTQIRSFPSADCQVIGDIDALVAGDLAEARVRRLLSHPLVAAEAERIALEVEEDVMGSVVGEAAASLALCSRL